MKFSRQERRLRSLGRRSFVLRKPVGGFDSFLASTAGAGPLSSGLFAAKTLFLKLLILESDAEEEQAPGKRVPK
jgi:hypothetical protein